MDKESLINELASSVGLVNLKETKSSGSYFDKETGTLYCNGMAITRNVAEEASRYFEALERQYLLGKNANKKLAMFYRCAIEAIAMMEIDDVKSIAKIMAEKR